MPKKLVYILASLILFPIFPTITFACLNELDPPSGAELTQRFVQNARTTLVFPSDADLERVGLTAASYLTASDAKGIVLSEAGKQRLMDEMSRVHFVNVGNSRLEVPPELLEKARDFYHPHLDAFSAIISLRRLPNLLLFGSQRVGPDLYEEWLKLCVPPEKHAEYREFPMSPSASIYRFEDDRGIQAWRMHFGYENWQLLKLSIPADRDSDLERFIRMQPRMFAGSTPGTSLVFFEPSLVLDKPEELVKNTYVRPMALDNPIRAVFVNLPDSK